MDLWSILVWIAVGAIAGILADWAIKGIRLRLLGKIIVGILGGLLGGWGWSLVGGGALGFFGQVLAAFLGAALLLIILRAFRRNRRR